MNVELLIRLLGGIGIGGGILYFGDDIIPKIIGVADRNYVFGAAALGFVLGIIITPYVTIKPFNWIVEVVHKAPPGDMISGVFGAIIGLVAAALSAIPLAMLPVPFGQILPVVSCIFLARLGVSFGLMRKKEISAIILNRWGKLADIQNQYNKKVILDTSAIIDGRIADINETGFIPGSILIPKFVLSELQHIADSPDVLRRMRGRRGLDVLEKLQKESIVPIEIVDFDYGGKGDLDVDNLLVKMAKNMGYPIITSDFNLNKVAGLQGVKVLNINALANALKPIVLPGEEMVVQLMQEGKEQGQGIAYLEDGTMVVVEGGKKYLNSEVQIVVSRVIQTVAGRMIFAQLKDVPQEDEVESRKL